MTSIIFLMGNDALTDKSPSGANSEVPGNAKSPAQSGDASPMTAEQAAQILLYQDAAIPASANVLAVASSIASFAQRLPEGQWTIGNGPGPIEDETPQEKRERKEREQIAALQDEMVEFLQQQREAWAREEHSYAGVTMTGEEWNELGDELKAESSLRQWLVARIKRDGKPAAEAERIADKVALLAKSEGLPPNQWTEDMKAARAEAEQNPDLKNYVRAATEAKRAGLDQAAPQADATANTTKLTSASARDSLFTSAPDLKEQHAMAVAAVEPLDKPAAQRAVEQAPIPQANAGLDF